jgi:ribosomal protein S8
MVLPHDLCSHIQNSFRARHKYVAVPHTTQNLGILTILLRAGFITNITRGTVSAPSPEQFHRVSEAQKRIWAELKYREDRPVLSSMELVSKPSKKINMTWAELLRLASGRRAKYIKPLGLGEIAIVKTKDREHEWVEAREALQLKLDGEVICRVR